MKVQLHDVGAMPHDPFVVVGTATLTAEYTFVMMALSPGADVSTTCQPQTVPLECNGYYVRARFRGIVTHRGYYGGQVGVENEHTWWPYAYVADDMLDGVDPWSSSGPKITLELTGSVVAESNDSLSASL